MLDLELLRRFVAVVESRSFTVAAQELRISQPALSQSIARMERDLGCDLFVRNKQNPGVGVLMTPAGEALHPDAIDLLEAAARTEARVRRAARADHRATVTIGFSPGTPREYLGVALSVGDDAFDVVALQLEWGREHEALLAGSIDIALLQYPADASLHDCQLFDLARFGRVALLPADHPLVGHASLSLLDLGGEPILDPGFTSGPVGFREMWLGLPRPATAPLGPVIGPPNRTVDEMYAFVAAHRGMAITSSVVPEAYQRPDVVARPIADLAPLAVGLGVRSDDRRGTVREAVRRIISGLDDASVPTADAERL